MGVQSGPSSLERQTAYAGRIRICKVRMDDIDLFSNERGGCGLIGIGRLARHARGELTVEEVQPGRRGVQAIEVVVGLALVLAVLDPPQVVAGREDQVLADAARFQIIRSLTTGRAPQPSRSR